MLLTQATNYTRLKDEEEDYFQHRLHDYEEAKFERDGKECGWFMLQTDDNWANPNSIATHFTYAKEATKQENAMSNWFRFHCKMYYSKDSNGRFYRTEQDEVIEVTTEEELKDRLSSCINYTEEFMRVHNAKRTLTFQ